MWGHTRHRLSNSCGAEKNLRARGQDRTVGISSSSRRASPSSGLRQPHALISAYIFSPAALGYLGSIPIRRAATWKGRPTVSEIRPYVRKFHSSAVFERARRPRESASWRWSGGHHAGAQLDGRGQARYRDRLSIPQRAAQMFFRHSRDPGRFAAASLRPMTESTISTGPEIAAKTRLFLLQRHLASQQLVDPKILTQEHLSRRAS